MCNAQSTKALTHELTARLLLTESKAIPLTWVTEVTSQLLKTAHSSATSSMALGAIWSVHVVTAHPQELLAS